MKLCGAPWLNLTVHHSGKVVACCADCSLSYPVGDIRHQSLEEIYNSERLRSLRQMHLTGKLPRHCRDCDAKQAYLVELSELIATLKEAGRTAQVEQILRLASKTI